MIALTTSAAQCVDDFDANRYKHEGIHRNEHPQYGKNFSIPNAIENCQNI